MKVRVRMFGMLAERVGLDEEVMDVPPGSTVSDIVGMVRERYPSVEGMIGHVSVAVNLEVVSSTGPLAEDDEVALLPPVAGGATIVTGLRDERPSIDEALIAVSAPDVGGTAVFVGTVRNHSEIGTVDRLEFSAYREMAERVLRHIAEEAAEKWPLAGVAILHAVGDLAVGETTVVVACSASHRHESLEACRHLIDEVKRLVPIWKKEVGPRGERWIGLESEAEGSHG